VRIDIERRGGGSVTQARLRILHRRAAVDEKAAVQVAWAVKAEVFHVGRVLRGMENRVQTDPDQAVDRLHPGIQTSCSSGSCADPRAG